MCGTLRDSNIKRKWAIIEDCAGHRVGAVILDLYVLFACLSSIYLYVTRNKLKLVLILLVLTVLLYFVSHAILFLIRRIPVKNIKATKKEFLTTFILYTVLSLMILGIWFISSAPGSYQDDNIAQFGQAIKNSYDNWHPVWHTLVCFKLPLMMTGSADSVVLFQIIMFSLVMGYMCATVRYHQGPVWTAGVFFFIMLNPYTGYSLMWPNKDNGFAICALFASVELFRIVKEGREIEYGPVRCGILGFILATATLFRYNGILFTGMFIVILVFFLKPRKWVVTLAVFIASYALVQGPLVKVIDADIKDTELIQIVGMPMSIIGNVTKETPELLDEETRDFVYNIAPADVWETRYMRGNFNLMKYGGIYNPDTIENSDFFTISAMALRCAIVSPQAALESFFSLTDFVYGFDTQDKADIDICKRFILDNDLGITYHGSEKLASVLDLYYKVVKLSGLNIFRKLGFMIFMIIAVLLAKTSLSSKDKRRMILVAIPILIYDLGTMMLLSGHDSRFFFLNFTICPLVTLLILGSVNIPEIIEKKNYREHL